MNAAASLEVKNNQRAKQRQAKGKQRANKGQTKGKQRAGKWQAMGIQRATDNKENKETMCVCTLQVHTHT